MNGRTWWKLVAAIVVGNILTGIVLWLVFMVGIASVFSGLSGAGFGTPSDDNTDAISEGTSAPTSAAPSPVVDTSVDAENFKCDPKLAADVGLKCT